MNPQEEFCPNMKCSAKGKIGEENIVIHSQKEKRCKCTICGKTFSIRKGTAMEGIKKDENTFVRVITLLAYGCPIKAIVAAFGLDERTVRSWLKRAGVHCQEVHEHFMEESNLELEQVQADEIKVKAQGGSLWLAMAMMVKTRLWLGGAVSPKRDKHLVRELAAQVRKWALCRPLLVSVDGFSAYVKAFRQAFRTPVKDKKGPGRPRMWEWSEVTLVQVVKHRSKESFSITRRIVFGCVEQLERLLQSSQGNGGMINTSYIERLNGTFRQRLASLSRRSRALLRAPETLEWGMYLVGCVYNFCTHHHSLRWPVYLPRNKVRWIQRTPATATGLTDHCWSVHELLTFKVPISPFVPPKRRGRPPKIRIAEAFS